MLIHTVQQGETLSQIARDYRTPLSNIVSANPSINPNILYIGQSIVIPGFPDPNHFHIKLRYPSTIGDYGCLKMGFYKKSILLL